MTRFGTHQTSSDEDSESGEESASRTSKKSKSDRKSITSKSEQSDIDESEENTLPEDKPNINQGDIEDFDDINETVD